MSGEGLRILICHGYLLRGTGSNQYVQSFARELCRQGHHLVVMCQDDDPGLDFVSRFLREEADGRVEVVWSQDTGYPGTCMVFRPHIGELLPVYVFDAYPGFTVREFPDLDDDELDSYVERNRASVERLVRQFVPDVINVNHTVMLPYIVRPVAERRGIPYFVTVHGSAIEFTVKKDPRFVAYGAEGLAGADGIIVLSEHSGAVVRDVFGRIVGDLEEKLTLLPPGVDTGLYRPTDREVSESVRLLLEEVDERLTGVAVGDFTGRMPASPSGGDEEVRIGLEVERINSRHPDWLPDPDIGRELRRLAGTGRPFLMFLGKLLETKGVQCVLAALPLIMAEYPDASLVVVGFGELRGILQLMVEAIDGGDIRRLKALCGYGNRWYTRAGSPFSPVLDFLDELAGEGSLDGYLRLCREMDVAGSVIFTGYLVPKEHSLLLPHARALLVPSLAPEAFGLVVSEAMACGVVPIASGHSGLEDALLPMREVWGEEAGLLTLGTPEKFVFRIAAAAKAVLGMPERELRERGSEMRKLVVSRFSWETVAKRAVEMWGQ